LTTQKPIKAKDVKTQEDYARFICELSLGIRDAIAQLALPLTVIEIPLAQWDPKNAKGIPNTPKAK